MTRAVEIAAFLADAGWPGAVPEWLAGDASTRRYARLLPPAILMDAPPDEKASNHAFYEVTALLRRAGFAAPEILAADVPRGLMVLEDLGDALFARVLEKEPALEAPLYTAAVTLLAALHGQSGLERGLPPYDAAAYAREVDLVPDWYVPALADRPATPAEAEALRGAVQAAIDALPPRPAVVVLRDYHAENLVWLPDREGHRRVGLLDYQDALSGHPAYDLVSLLEDARRDTSPALRQAMMATYAEASAIPLEEVRGAVATLGAQRNLKILGIFARLCRRDGKPRYLSLIPRVWGHLQRDLAHPALAEVAEIVAQLLPAPTPERLALAERAA